MSSLKKLQNYSIENAATIRIVLATVFLGIVFFLGSVGYHVIEGLSFFDGFYMTFITITTIGFREVSNLSVEGRILTIVVFVLGIGVISYIASQTTQLIFESELFFERMMNKRIKKMKDHYIICGYGRIGHRIAQDLKKADLPVVIVENRESSIDRIKKDQLEYVEGNAQDEESLLSAGIQEAKALICSLSSDQDNVFTTLVARELKPDIFILVRTNENKNRRKILKAGANKVISPYEIGADRMANVILRPNVDKFLEKMTSGDHQDHTFEEVQISDKSDVVGKSLMDIHVRNKFSVLIIAIIPGNGSIDFNPGGDTVLNEGDSLIVLGDQDKIDVFRTTVCQDERSLSERAEEI
ncbi:potassium channel family protein [Gracilimonas sp. Q87]|uniref:potassium channel family protein n=1 Tax=Gracilimonas sp. Q87 TaxID=3384766 RepID=UPI003983E38F